MVRFGDSSYRSRASVWWLWLFRRGQKVTYRQIRYGSEDFNNIDHADNNLANGFLGFLVFAVILILIAK
ncbi:hypothetical protein [uncultured Phocaeicola sp.]|uniref:hypothetical protein n=1 Tax=uncultured Phocaeicola sp. TaxID=990718 RepID=UPI0025A03E62|nr:hypothetical protein [uncultured Phocaeicola sp.]